MSISVARIALLGLGGATTVSGAYLMLKPDSSDEDATVSQFYDSMRDSIISEEDREELKQMGIEVQKGIKENNQRFSAAALWLLEKENYKTIFREIADVIKKPEGWRDNVQKLGKKLNELIDEVKKDKAESARVGLPEDQIVSKALKADLENMNEKLDVLRKACLQSSTTPRTMDCNLEKELYLPSKQLLDLWKEESSPKEPSLKK